MSTPHGLQLLDLEMSNPALLDIKGPESLSSLWGVLTRCKRSLKDGERLENISWRLWYQACVNASISHGRTQSALDTCSVPPQDGEEASLSEGSEGWTSDVASSDSDIETRSISTQDREETGQAEEREDESEGNDDDYETDSQPSSPETPPPQPTPTRPSFKSGLSTGKARGKVPVRARKQVAAAAHGRQKSVAEASVGKNKAQGTVEQVSQPEVGVIAVQQSDNGVPTRIADTSTKPAEINTTTAPIPARKHVSSTTYSSSTPKASSYPTPSASYVPSQAHSSTAASPAPAAGIARSRSHLETGRHSHSGNVGVVWGQWRRAGEKSFGEVVDDVFKGGRVEDLVPSRRVMSREVPVVKETDTERRSGEAGEDDRLMEGDERGQIEVKDVGPGDGEDAIPWNSNSTAKPIRILQEEISPRTTPGLQTVYHESPLQMPLDPPQAQPSPPAAEQAVLRPPSTDQIPDISSPVPLLAPSIGPIVRVVEPTPAPSRVGSAGELSPLGGRLLASNAINHGFLRMKKQRQQPAEVVTRRESGTSESLVNGYLESKTGASSAGKPLSVRRTSSARSNHSRSSGAYSPTVEIEDPMEAAGAQQVSPTTSTSEQAPSPILSSSVVQRLNDSATARPHKSSSKQAKHAEHQAQLHAQQAAKKNKKSIFFIQSPGDNRSRRTSGRHGSVSGGSEASTDPDAGSFAGSSVGADPAGSVKSPARNRSTSSGAATSPLAQEVVRPGIEERLGETSVKLERSKPPSELKDDSHAPSGPPRANSDSGAPPTHRRASGGNRASIASGLKRTSSTAHANAHAGHARHPSVHQMTHATTGHAKTHTTAAANAGAAKRTDSMSNMAGRLREMKANAAAAISARLAAQQKAEKERLTEQRAKLLASKRQRSEPDMLAAQQRLIAEAEQDQDGSDNDEDYEDVDDDTAAGEEEDDDAWSSATDESAKGAGLVIGKAKPKPKRDPAAIAAAKALAAEEDAKRKRELFAKRAIFGTGGMSGLSTVTPVAPRANSPGELNPANATGASKPGLLTNLFERQRDVLRRGDSMVSLVEPSHSVPPRVHATEGTRQREGTTPSLGFNFMNRSKSSAALPIASGISVTTGGLINSSHSLSPSKDAESKTTPIRGKLRLPPKPDEDADFSPSSSPENTSSMLATSEAVRRLEALSTKRRSSARSNLSQETTEPVISKSPDEVQEAAPRASALTAALERTQSHPMPVQQHSVQFVEPAMPQTPTTRRRQMLATELPEDLRMNLLFERKSRASVYPKSSLRATASVHDLPEAGRESEFSSTEMSRQTSHNPSDEVASKREVSPNSAAQPPARRRSGPNLLSGGNLLRPLTSASTANVVRGQSEANTQRESSQSAVRQPLQRDQRSKSSANVSDLSRVDAHRGIGFGGWGGPDFKRRSTEGDNRDASAAEQRLARLKALREREGELSSSFRSHGW